jgi:hypothetical protein
MNGNLGRRNLLGGGGSGDIAFIAGHVPSCQTSD